MTSEKRNIWGWAFYDWANSAFATTVMAGFFPVFFKQYWSIGADVNTSTAMLAYANSAASLIVALMGPILGAAADSGSRRKRLLVFFAYLGVLMTACLFLVDKGQWGWAAFFYCMGIVGFSGSNIFYDSLLPGVAGPDKVDRVSGLGFGLGYLGGGLLFLINVIMTQQPELFGLANAGEAVRWSFLSVALWWGLFTLVTIIWVDEQKNGEAVTLGHALRQGFRQFSITFAHIREYKPVLMFLLAYWLYIDGVDTIVRMAVDYGLSIGFKDSDLILALLITQFVAFPSAILYTRLGERWDVKKAIQLAIVVYIGVTLWATQMDSEIEFYTLAVVIGLVQGGIQALSRSYYSRLIPADRAGEFYGFYNMIGKFAAIIGPLLIGTIAIAVRHALMPADPTAEQIVEVGLSASRWSIGSVVVLFVAGGGLLWTIKEE
tara:strand:- start:6421 stop:7719 length:1299 start_codon:yes stop_codon:yes gene_type:complete